MEIRLKLTLQFSVLVAILLLGILSINYILAYRFAEESFFERLRQRAITVGDLLSDSASARHPMLAANSLPNETVVGLSNRGKILFQIGKKRELPEKIATNHIQNGIEFEEVRSYQYSICFPVTYGKNTIWVYASAKDEVGSSKLLNMAQTMLFSFLLFLIFVVWAGQYLARKALEPIQSVIKQVQQITARNLDSRVQHENNRDEITQLSQTFNLMLERLEDSFKSQADFVRNSSHELRNPLAAMIGQAEIALKKDRDRDYYKDVIQAVYQEGLRLKHLTNNLLQLSRASNDAISRTHEMLRLDELLLDVAEKLIIADPRRKITVKLPEKADQEPIIEGNKNLLESAIGNLIDNACKFSEFRKVNCELSFENENLVLLVEDQGCGMSEETITRIYEPFYRAPESRNQDGFGIGMAVAARVFKLHEAAMEIDSEPGKGTAIRIKFNCQNIFPVS